MTWNVLYPNAEGKITLVGKLDPHAIPLPSGPQYPDPPGSVYHPFVLHRWYMDLPFKEIVLNDPNDELGDRHQVVRSSLEKRDFDAQGWCGRKFDPQAADFDPTRYQRKAIR